MKARINPEHSKDLSDFVGFDNDEESMPFTAVDVDDHSGAILLFAETQDEADRRAAIVVAALNGGTDGRDKTSAR